MTVSITTRLFTAHRGDVGRLAVGGEEERVIEKPVPPAGSGTTVTPVVVSTASRCRCRVLIATVASMVACP
jgi:hypothetical protein